MPIIGQLPDNSCPLPDEFTVVAYLPERSYLFHNGPIIEKLANDFPFIKFIVIGTDRPYFPQNIFSTKWISNMVHIYEQLSVLLRIPYHDGL